MSVSNKTLLKNQQKTVRQPTPAHTQPPKATPKYVVTQQTAPRVVSNPMASPQNVPQVQTRVRTTTQDIVIKEATYVDLKKTQQPKKLHLTAVTMLFVAAVLFFQIGKVMTDRNVEAVRATESIGVNRPPPPPPVATTRAPAPTAAPETTTVVQTTEVYKPIEAVQMPEVVEIKIPRVNSYERQLVYDEIVKKYNILKFNSEQQRNVELAAFRDANRKFYDHYGYQAIYDKYRSIRTELMAQKDVEMCEKVGAHCDRAEDYKNYQATRSPASPLGN